VELNVFAAETCSKNCKPNPRSFSPPAFLTVTRYRVVQQVLPIERVCVDCGAVLAPEDLAEGKYRADTREIINVLRERKAATQSRLRDVLNRTGTYRDLGLPTWLQIPGEIPRLGPSVRNQVLQKQTADVRLASVTHALGLTPDHPTLTVKTAVGDITLSEELARKLSKRDDSGHNQLVHVGVATFRAPREIWEDGDKRRYLGLYQIPGEAPATQMAVAHRTGEYAYTIYEIDDSISLAKPGATRDSIEHRTNAKRHGTCLHVAYLTDDPR